MTNQFPPLPPTFPHFKRLISASVQWSKAAAEDDVMYLEHYREKLAEDARALSDGLKWLEDCERRAK